MKVYIPDTLRSYTGDQRTVTAQGATLAALLIDLDRQFPGIRFRMIDEQGHLRPHIKLFIDQALTRDIRAPIPTGATVMIVAALSGG